MPTIRTRHLGLCILLSLISWSGSLAKDITDFAEGISPVDLMSRVENIRYEYPDSALSILDKAFHTYLEEGDTLSAIETIFVHTNINGNQANYKDAYNMLWKGLSLADLAGMNLQKSRLYIRIGRYYSFYKKRTKALEYFQLSLDINRELLAKGEIHEAKLVNNYYTFCSTYRELDDFPMAKKYIDSCFLYYDAVHSPISEPYLKFEAACIANDEGEYAKALTTFHEQHDWFVANEPSYLVLYYTYMGDAYLGLNEVRTSEQYFRRALDISEAYNMHIDFSPIVHEKLSMLYLGEGNHLKAYESLKRVKDLDCEIFDSRSEKNRSLLEIQDAFRMEQKAQLELIQQQKLERLEHERDVWFLQRVITIGGLGCAILLGFLYFSYIRTRHKSERELLRKEKELELQKANEVLEVKNKELAASALRLIEKDENLNLLKNKIKEVDGKLDARELKKIVRSISVSNDQNWKEFRTRFVSVNKGFYDKMQVRFPALSQRDLKLCALIKLNFSCKEMAKLLGISVESAHTSRYRLRKKLNLTRDVNLTEFIASQ